MRTSALEGVLGSLDWRLALLLSPALIAIARGFAPPSAAMQWRNVDIPSTTGAGAWRVIDPAAPGLRWQAISEQQLQQQQQLRDRRQQEAEAELAEQKRIIPPSGPTFANYRALWRDGDWLPQISSLVPVGFGPKGVMLSLYGRAIDCNTGKGQCPGFTTYSAWQQSLDQLSSGQFQQVIGFGDPIKAVSVVFSNSSERLTSNLRSGQLESSSFFSGNQTGVHLVKAFGPDTSVRTGIDNLIRWDSDNTYYDPLSFYAVATQRIRINDDRSPWFSSVYLTAGVGNGDFRPIEQIVQAQTAALRAAGCPTYGYSPTKPCSQDAYNSAIQSGSNYGTINPIGSIGLEVYRGVNLITEWTGRNLNIGMSWRPVPEWGFVITPMVQSVVQNCEYPGCRVSMPGANDSVELPSSVLTQRARLSVQASVEVKF